MDDPRKHADLYRMVTAEHICPFGLKSRHLLRRKGYTVDDHLLRDRDETDAFKEREGVDTTPQTFVEGRRIGGYDDLRRYFGLHVRNPDATRYTPVLAVFVVAAAMALAAHWAAFATLLSWRALEWVVAFAMCLLACLKLRDLQSFSNMFLGYDLLAQRMVPYAYVYPFAELLAGLLMVAGLWPWLSGPLALFIGVVGAVSVFKAVYVDKRELKCACVGGGSNVPLGFISLSENLAMIAMGLWTLLR